MEKDLAEYWWLIAIRGILTILLGLFALVYPVATLAVLILVFGIFALIQGIITAIVGLATVKKDNNWWMMLLEGVVGIFIGIFVLKYTGITVFLMVYLIGLWALVAGVFGIIAGFSLRKEMEGEWLLILIGFAGVVLGILVLTNPASALVVVPTLLGIYGILVGILLMAFAFKVKKLK